MLSIDTTVGYNRVLATVDITFGTILIHLDGVMQSSPTKYSVQINEDKHLQPHATDYLTMKELIWPCLNHSCNPNAFININTLQLLALKDIKANEEITFDYESTESQMREPFQCQCKSPDCRGLIRGKIFSTSFSLDQQV